MKNIKVLMGAGFGIVIVLYNFILFTLAGDKTSSFWSAYVFTMIAFAIQVIAFLVSYKKNAEIKDIFFGLPLSGISLIYLGIQLVLGIVLMIISFSVTVANVLQSIVLAGYLILAISAIIGRNTVEAIDAKTKEKVFFIRSLESNILSLKDRVADSTFQKKLNDLSEIIKYSDPMSHESLAVVEQKIEAKAAILDEKIQSNNIAGAIELCCEIEVLMADRNRKCKLLK